jgi:hypothetical protein
MLYILCSALGALNKGAVAAGVGPEVFLLSLSAAPLGGHSSATRLSLTASN